MIQQVVQIPLEKWERIERLLIRFDKEQKPVARRADWKTAGEFMKATGMTRDEIRGLRGRHPELVKPKAGPTVSGRYLYDLSGYERIYNA